MITGGFLGIIFGCLVCLLVIAASVGDSGETDNGVKLCALVVSVTLFLASIYFIVYLISLYIFLDALPIIGEIF